MVFKNLVMELKKKPKADLSRFSLIFFQVGVIIVLGITYYGIELKFPDRATNLDYEIAVPELDMDHIPVTEIKDILLPPPPPPPIPEVIEVIADEMDVEETEIQSTETSQEEKIEKVIEVAEIKEEKPEEKIAEVPFVLIEDVPIYPGCENERDNAARKNCMSTKIDQLVKKKFNTGLGEKLNLYGVNKIYVVFRIDETGIVTDIKTRGPHRALEAEAERVIRLLPKMSPGKQRNRPVSVVYSLPITFEVLEDGLY